MYSTCNRVKIIGSLQMIGRFTFNTVREIGNRLHLRLLSQHACSLDEEEPFVSLASGGCKCLTLSRCDCNCCINILGPFAVAIQL